ncbi:hypothetical protein F2Q70_00043469 [Brassica cretica]|uniref:H15 domain-containing protein n=1 Tax=Brassica cretica TaxID=69181 RepID=A0A8S9KLR4_BRACR|nr:hypothetical protein F2Q70_00043469 [Brassica cretica]
MRERFKRNVVRPNHRQLLEEGLQKRVSQCILEKVETHYKILDITPEKLDEINEAAAKAVAVSDQKDLEAKEAYEAADRAKKVLEENELVLQAAKEALDRSFEVKRFWLYINKVSENVAVGWVALYERITFKEISSACGILMTQRFYKRKFSVPLTFDSKHEISLALHQCCCITFSSEVSIFRLAPGCLVIELLSFGFGSAMWTGSLILSEGIDKNTPYYDPVIDAISTINDGNGVDIEGIYQFIQERFKRNVVRPNHRQLLEEGLQKRVSQCILEKVETHYKILDITPEKLDEINEAAAKAVAVSDQKDLEVKEAYEAADRAKKVLEENELVLQAAKEALDRFLENVAVGWVALYERITFKEISSACGILKTQRFYKRKFSVPLTFDSKHEISLALHQCCCITFSSEVFDISISTRFCRMRSLSESDYNSFYCSRCSQRSEEKMLRKLTLRFPAKSSRCLVIELLSFGFGSATWTGSSILTEGIDKCFLV